MGKTETGEKTLRLHGLQKIPPYGEDYSLVVQQTGPSSLFPSFLSSMRPGTFTPLQAQPQSLGYSETPGQTIATGHLWDNILIFCTLWFRHAC